jgi:hypothetical protein
MSEVLFDAFWQASGEPSFEALSPSCEEFYRLSIRTSLRPEHKIIRMQRPASLVAYFFTFGPDLKSASAVKYEISLEEAHWRAMDALLDVAEFWGMGEDTSGGFDGATYTLEAWKRGRAHHVSRWSPSAIPGGELFSVVTDYMERLAELAWFECELHERYAGPGYVPRHRLLPRGNIP